MNVLPVAFAVAVAWAAGASIVARAWPGREPLPVAAWLGLAGLVGPCVVGAALLCAGMLGIPASVSCWLITLTAIAAAVGARVRRPRPASGVRTSGIVPGIALAVTLVWAGWLSSRTHLGWDGTLVWYHKARVIAASSGVMPRATMADRTRAWVAPDYPLQVPLALAWVRIWQPVEDERAIKVLPAAWCAAIFLVVVAAVLERSAGDSYARLRAAGALVVLATVPRALVGEGSFTSGYADGPAAGLLAALVWLAWRSDWGRVHGWQSLLALVAAGLAWTKQEGLVPVVLVAVTCGWRQRHVSAGAFALPALVLAGTWHAYAIRSGAPAAMAYAWPGVETALSRVPVIARAYLAEAFTVRDWGLFWPGLVTALVATRASGKELPLLLIALTGLSGASAFTLSAWPDLGQHLLVTAPRQLLQLAPALAIVTFAVPSKQKTPRALT